MIVGIGRQVTDQPVQTTEQLPVSVDKQWEGGNWSFRATLLQTL